VAHPVYVDTASGWLSDRTVRYLACGRPALVEDTGAGGRYPVGEGLVTFRTVEQAVAGAAAIVGDYEAHAQAARSLAETHFDSDVVLSRFLDLALAP
jgi:glycosyltransferase involved in cell wall biosynthesis